MHKIDTKYMVKGLRSMFKWEVYALLQVSQSNRL